MATQFALLRVPLRTANRPFHGRRPGERVRKASELRRLEGTRARSWTWSRLGDLNPGPTHYEGVSAGLSLTGVPLRCSAFERGSASNSVTICGKSGRL